MWKQMYGDKVEDIYLPTSLEDYNRFKDMYYGGRVLPTVAQYDTQIWTKGGANPYSGEAPDFGGKYDKETGEFIDFDEKCHRYNLLNDELKMVDVVSLYPSVMRDFQYPVGKHVVHIYDANLGEGEEPVRQAKRFMSIIKQGAHEIVGYDYEKEKVVKIREAIVDVHNDAISMDDPTMEVLPLPFTPREVQHISHTHRIDNRAYNELKKYMHRSCFCVDIHPTKPLLIAFLIRRNSETGSPEQSLAPMTNHWVTGPELFEAIKIGYEVTKVHGYISWPRTAPVFVTFINKLFEIKEANKKDKNSAMYIAAKLLMNSLSGKFGQKLVSNKTIVSRRMPDGDPENVDGQGDSPLAGLVNLTVEEISRIPGMEGMLIPEEGVKTVTVGYIISGDKPEADLKPNLPIHFSMMILAHSRVRMSKALRAIEGYTDPRNNLLYTDTDSLILRKEAYMKLCNYKRGKLVGHRLGQLEDEFPKEHIIAARFLAPKTYCLAMLKQVEDKWYYALKVRCKGIPHRGDVFIPLLEAKGKIKAPDYWENEDMLERLDKTLKGPVGDLRKRYYILINKDTGERVMTQFLDIEVFSILLTRPEYLLEVHFGSIVRNKTGPLIISSYWVHRCMGKLSWWKESASCSRLMLDDEGIISTLCKGYQGAEMPTAEDGVTNEMVSDAMFLIDMGDMDFFEM